MSILSGVMYPRKLCAIVGLSGYLPLRQKFEVLRQGANKSTPVWLGHGTSDPVVNFKVGYTKPVSRQDCLNKSSMGG